MRPSCPLVGRALDIHRDVAHADPETEQRETADDHRADGHRRAEPGQRQADAGRDQRSPEWCWPSRSGPAGGSRWSVRRWIPRRARRRSGPSRTCWRRARRGWPASAPPNWPFRRHDNAKITKTALRQATICGRVSCDPVQGAGATAGWDTISSSSDRPAGRRGSRRCDGGSRADSAGSDDAVVRLAESRNDSITVIDSSVLVKRLCLSPTSPPRWIRTARAHPRRIVSNYPGAMAGPTSSDRAAKRPTLAEVAALAGVSVSTASLAFSGSGPVSGSTRDRVLAAAEELHYAGPDPRGRSLRQGRSGIIGVVMEERILSAFRDPIAIAILDGIAQETTADGRGLLLLADVGQSAVAMESASMDGVILLGCSSRISRSIEIQRRRAIPAVALGGPAVRWCADDLAGRRPCERDRGPSSAPISGIGTSRSSRFPWT